MNACCDGMAETRRKCEKAHWSQVLLNSALSSSVKRSTSNHTPAKACLYGCRALLV